MIMDNEILFLIANKLRAEAEHQLNDAKKIKGSKLDVELDFGRLAIIAVHHIVANSLNRIADDIEPVMM